jgi:hypothetical protein
MSSALFVEKDISTPRAAGKPQRWFAGSRPVRVGNDSLCNARASGPFERGRKTWLRAIRHIDHVACE